MLFLKHVSLFAAVWTFALAQYDTPPDSAPTCSSGAYRCDNNTLLVRGDDIAWHTVKECSKTAYCFAQDTADGGGDCYPLVRGGNMQCSTVNDHRCNTNSLQECGDHGYWSTVKNCTQTAYCFAQDTIDGGGDCHPLVAGLTEQCSVADEHRCQNNTLQACTDHGYWKTTKTCSECETCSHNSKYVDGGTCLHTNSTGDPEFCDRPGTERCLHDPARVQSCTGNLWVDKELCPKGTICWADKNFDTGDETASCEPVPSFPPLASSKRTDFEYCDQRGFDRCAYDPDRVQHCSIGHNWVNKEFCANGTSCLVDKNVDTGEETVACIDLPIPSSVSHNTPRTCTPGDFTCDANFYALRKCNDNGSWETTKKCLTPGDCQVNGPGQAHCKSGGMDPPKLKVKSKSKSKRSYSTCSPGSLACDKDRRFLFTCGTDGKWESNPIQCFGAGFCRPEGSFALTCAGFPVYDGEDGVCNSHCESMDYLYCVGGKWESPDVVRKCLQGMCDMEDCRTCDRCTFKIPYGLSLQPDLSTLVHSED